MRGGPTAGRQSAAPASARRSSRTCCRRARARDRSPGRFEHQVALDLCRLLRPRDPEPIRRVERRLQALEAALEILPARGEEHHDPGAWLRAELLRKRRARVLIGHATKSGARPRARARGPPRRWSERAREPLERCLPAAGSAALPRGRARRRPVRAPAMDGSAIQSGSSIHSPTSCASRNSDDTQVISEAVRATSRHVSRSSAQLRPGCVALKIPATSRSQRSTIH